MGPDRSDEIRAVVMHARVLGWAARLEHASLVLKASEENVTFARAIVDDVVREMQT